MIKVAINGLDIVMATKRKTTVNKVDRTFREEQVWHGWLIGIC